VSIFNLQNLGSTEKQNMRMFNNAATKNRAEEMDILPFDFLLHAYPVASAQNFQSKALFKIVLPSLVPI